MEDDEQFARKKSHPPSAAKMSKVPSWISVGFVLGALVGWTVREPKPVSSEPARVIEVVKLEPRPNKIATVEAIFEQWRHLAAWRDDDTTEIAIWNPDTNAFSEYYEVRRIGDAFYFRTIPRLTRKLVNYSAELPSSAPIKFAGVENAPRENRRATPPSRP
jgi:hypothetical protein